MADPLSVSASIIALLQLSGTVIGYFKDVKDASKDCANILLEISSASSLLHSLNNLITRSDAQGFQFAMVASLAVPYGPLDQFKSVLERLSEKICPVDRFKRAVRVIAWSLKKDEVKELLSTIERLKSLFSLALQSDNFNLSHGMEADVVEIKREVLLQASQSRRAEDLDTLKWLTATKPTEAHLRIRERRLPGTGQWLLETPEFTAWRDEEQVSNILWCHGIPGAGKTIISSIVIDHLNDKFAGQNIGAVYAYCDFNNPQSQSAVSMLANLLKQLALSNSSVMAYVTKLYERHTVLDTYPDVSELETAFLDACQDFQRIFLVVDALDECDIDIQRELVLKVLRSLKTSCVRMFVTSRPHPDDIRELFQDSPQITIEASSEDIEKYIRATIEDSGKAARVMGDDLKEKVIIKIRDEAQGMFLLPRLQIQTILRKKNRREMREALEELPTSLNEIFEDTFIRIRRQSEENIDLAMKILEWIFLAQRPLTVQELCQALSVRSGDLSLDEDGYYLPEDMVDVCLGLVILDEAGGEIRFVHFTVHEFLNSEATEIFPLKGTRLTSACLTFLLFEEFRTGPCSDNESFEIRLQNYRFFDYASRYWGVHLKECLDEANDELALTLLKTEPCLLSILQNTHNKGYGDYSQRYTKLSALHLAASLGLTAQVKALLDSGFDINAHNEEAGSALHLAVKDEHEHIVSYLLQQGADPSLLDEDNFSPLHLSALAGSLAMTTLLCDAGADLLATNEDGRTALHIAAEGGYSDVYQYLIKRGMDVLSEDRYGGSVLHEAAEKGDLDLVKLLLENGANALSINSSKETAVHQAASSGHLSVVRLLHEHGCPIDTADDSGGRPLHRAACRGHTETMRFLLENGADPQQVDAAYDSAIHEAAESGNTASIQILLDYGVDINLQTESKETVIHKAAANRDDTVLPFLVEKGAILDHARNGDGQNPLHIAASYGREANVRYLVENGADIEATGEGGSTPLFESLDHTEDTIATFLIGKGADTTKIGWNGNTMLHKAAESSSVAMMRLLLQGGADVMALNKEKKTVLQMRYHDEDIEGAQFLIDSGVDINHRDSEGITVLHEALESGNDTLVLLLGSKGVDVMAKSNSGKTAFHFAADCIYKLSVFQFLQANGAELDAKDKSLETPLHCAAENDNSPLIRFLVQNGADVTATTKQGYSVLQKLAGNGGNSESAELLIAHGADPKGETRAGLTVLHSSVASGSAEKSLIRLLVEKGADVNAKNDAGITVLHAAARNSSQAIVRYLIEQGADVNAKTAKGTSVIHFATENDDPERIIMLLAGKGADIEERDMSGRTSLLTAGSGYGGRLLVRYLVEMGSNVLAKSKMGNTILHQTNVLEDIVLVRYLLDKGAKAAVVNAAGVSVLHMAIEHGDEDTVRLLVESGASPKAVDKKGLSALHRAVKRNDLGVINFLLEKGANIMAKDKTGRTVLHFAVENLHEAMVQLLIEKGANINAVDTTGVTVLHKAVEAKQISTVRNLVERGAQVNTADKQGLTALHHAVKGNFKAIEKIVQKTRTIIDLTEGSGWKEAVETAKKENDLALAEILIEHGADVNAEDKNGVTAIKIASDEGFAAMMELLYEKGINKTPLFAAAEKGHEAEVRMILKKGVNVDSKSPEKLTPLCYAVGGGHASVVQLLLENGADVETMGKYGQKLLVNAVNKGFDTIVKLLIDKGADIDIITEFDLMVLEFDMHMRENAVAALREQNIVEDDEEETLYGLRLVSMAAGNGHEAVVKLLLEREAALNSKHRHDRTPIYVAAWGGNPAVLELLLQNAGEINLRSDMGKVLLWLTVFRGHEAAAKLLLEKGADIAFKYEAGRPLLSYAAEQGHRAVVELLLERGADIEAKDDEGRTAMVWASEGRKNDILELLREKSVEAIQVPKERYDGTKVSVSSVGEFAQ